MARKSQKAYVKQQETGGRLDVDVVVLAQAVGGNWVWTVLGMLSIPALVVLYCLTRRTASIAAGPAGSAAADEPSLASLWAMRGVH